MLTVSNNKICVIIPAFNEAKVVGGVIDSVKKTFKKDTDILVINDASRDNTAEVAKKHGAIVITHVLNGGIGAGLPTSTGLRAAQVYGYDYAVTMDADGQHDPRDAKKALDYLMKHELDLVIGNRLADTNNMSWLKKLGNWGLSTITYLLFGVRVGDSQSGLRAFSKTALHTIRLRTAGYEFGSEMLWRARQANLKIGEVPIRAIYTNYSQAAGRGQNNWNGFVIVRSLIKRRLLEAFYE